MAVGDIAHGHVESSIDSPWSGDGSLRWWGRWIAWTTRRSLPWSLEAAVLQATTGACSWERSCRAGAVQLATQLLTCSARYFVFRDNSRSRLAEVLFAGWAVVDVARKGCFKGVKCCRSLPREMVELPAAVEKDTMFSWSWNLQHVCWHDAEEDPYSIHTEKSWGHNRYRELKDRVVEQR